MAATALLQDEFVVEVQQAHSESIPVMEPSGSTGYMLPRTGSSSVLKFAGISSGKVAAAIGAATLVLAPAFAATPSKKRPAPVSLSFDPGMTFTPAAADPRLAAAFANGAPSLEDFKFTPAAPKGRPSQVRVAVRAKATTPQQVAKAEVAASAAAALAPVTYNLGVAVGWRRFAVSGDVGKISPAGSPLDGRENAVVGVSYSLPRFTGRLAVSADRSDEHSAPPLRQPDNYALDVGGSYSLSRRLAVTGGVRYKVAHDKASTLTDQRIDSQAVYVGTAFKF
jgi:hypothetical protein